MGHFIFRPFLATFRTPNSRLGQNANPGGTKRIRNTLTRQTVLAISAIAHAISLLRRQAALRSAISAGQASHWPVFARLRRAFGFVPNQRPPTGAAPPAPRRRLTTERGAAHYVRWLRVSPPAQCSVRWSRLDGVGTPTGLASARGARDWTQTPIRLRVICLLGSVTPRQRLYSPAALLLRSVPASGTWVHSLGPQPAKPV